MIRSTPHSVGIFWRIFVFKWQCNHGRRILIRFSDTSRLDHLLFFFPPRRRARERRRWNPLRLVGVRSWKNEAQLARTADRKRKLQAELKIYLSSIFRLYLLSRSSSRNLLSHRLLKRIAVCSFSPLPLPLLPHGSVFCCFLVLR